MAKQRIFITGASGYVGSSVTELAIAHGYEVYGLSRSETSDAKLTRSGAIPVRGDLHAHDVLREQSAKADMVIHLAACPSRDPSREYEEVLRIDAGAVDAMCAGLVGSNKPFVITSGSLVVAATGSETDEASPSWEKPLNARIKSEQHALEFCKKGVKVSAIRSAPFVYGRGGSGIRSFMTMFANAGEGGYVDSGRTLTSTVHVDDAAASYLLAVEKAKAGDIFNGVSGTVTFRALTEAIGEVLDIPVRSVPYDEAEGKWGKFFARFLSTENWASGARAKKELGWAPKEFDVLGEVETGSYLAVAESSKKPVTE